MSNITYKNLISPLGITLSENFEAICNGKSGLKPHSTPLFYGDTYTSNIEESFIDSQFSKYDCPEEYSKLEKLSILAIQDIVDNTEINVKSSRILLIYSTTKGNINLIDCKNKRIPQKRIYLSEFKNIIKNYFGFINDPILVSNACVSGSQAILLADTLLKTNKYDDILVVGGDLVSRFTLSGFTAINAISKELCKPFDKKRDGINIGECCASLVLSKETKNKKTFAVLTSGSSTVDAHHIVAPSRLGVGLTNAIKRCLKEQDKTKIDFISTHGTATVYNDEMEALSIMNNGLQEVPSYSLKGYFGHTLGASGILEVVISIEAMEKGYLIPSKGFDTLGVSYPINIIQKLVKQESNCFLKTASGFGGVNTTLLINKV